MTKLSGKGWIIGLFAFGFLGLIVAGRSLRTAAAEPDI